MAILTSAPTRAAGRCDDAGTREIRRVARADACFHNALDNAVVAVHNERLSSLYHGRTGAGAT